jgi:predicted lysophospholipase L1 biosynthesis ABC-type transport system permease subunit
VKERDQLLGDYALDPLLQAIEPRTVLSTVLEVVLRLRDALLRFYGLVLTSMLAFFGLIVSLSMRLRAADLELMRRIGSARFTVARILVVEMAIMLLGAAVLSVALVELAMAVIQRSVL